MWINSKFLKSVIPLGISSDAEKQSVLWIGTAFMVGAKNGYVDDLGNPKYSAWLVTAKHLLERKEFVVLGFNSDESLSALCIPTSFNGKAGWHAYTDDNPAFGTVDIAVLPLQYDFLKHFKIAVPFLNIEESLADPVEFLEGQPVICSGYPLQQTGKIKNENTPNQFRAIVRHGIIARSPHPEDETQRFLVDTIDSHGNSGGPVTLAYMRIGDGNSQQCLAGLLSGFIPDNAKVTNESGNVIEFHDKEGNKINYSIRQNSGLAVVETSKHIVELIKSYPKDRAGLPFEEAKTLGLV